MRWLVLILLFSTSLAFGQSATREKTDSIAINSAYMNFTFQGAVSLEGSEQVGTNATNLAIEWSRYFRKDVALLTGYRIARGTGERTRYQAGMAGLRVFPWSTGVPIRSFRNLALVNYDFDWKPYFDGLLTLGRYLVVPQFKKSIADISAEFWGIMFATGTTYKVTESNNLDLRFGYEMAFGYGPLNFRASTIYASLGWSYYL